MIEKYAFITNENYELHSTSMWPSAIAVGAKYRMVQFTDKDEPDLIDYIESLGFAAKYLDGESTISSLNNGDLGPFVCNHLDASLVVHYFNENSGEMT